MIISHIIGGLGNQMFQHALGRAQSTAKNVPLRLDLRDFSDYALHNGYELNRVFGISTPQASATELGGVLGLRAQTGIRRLLMRRWLAGLRGRHLVIESQIAYWPDISAIPDECYLLGNWHSEKYFQAVESQVRSDFAFPLPLVGLNAEREQQIAGCTAISVHVRRGDFAADPATLAVHGLCSLDYYRKAIAHITSRVINPQFFMFSNDMAWVRDNLHIDHPCHYIDHNTGLDSHIDMLLMSRCRHHIIANSSFSWWGAWLNPSREKIVVAPERWFAANWDSSDIIPPAWARL